jgi:hypothetical protein
MPPTTSSKVGWLFSPIDPRLDARDRAEEQARRDAYKVQEADEAIATLAQEWAAELPDSITNDYLWNVRVVANMGEITGRNFGIAVSMISAYQREVEKLAGIERERKTRPVSQFVGTIGKREDFTVTLNKTIGFEGQYGTTTLHIFTDAAGNRLTWFKSGSSDMDETHTYIIKGTVKAHEVYTNKAGRDENQTVLTRCKILKEIEDAAGTPDASVMNIFESAVA